MVLDEREPNDYELRKRIQSEEAKKRNKQEPLSLHQLTESVQDYWKRVASQGKYDELPKVLSGEVHSVREMRSGSRRLRRKK